MSSRSSEIITTIFSGLFWVVVIAATIIGIVHSSNKHSSIDTYISITCPPWAVYRAIESIWHNDDDTDDDVVDWEMVISKDVEKAVYLLEKSSGEDVNIYELYTYIDEFADEISCYPDDKKMILENVVECYVKYSKLIMEALLPVFAGDTKTPDFPPEAIRLEEKIVGYFPDIVNDRLKLFELLSQSDFVGNDNAVDIYSSAIEHKYSELKRTYLKIFGHPMAE